MGFRGFLGFWGFGFQGLEGFREGLGVQGLGCH